MKTFFLTTAATLSCLLTLLLVSPSPVFGQTLSDAARKQDPRLEKRVTVLTPRGCYVGELLELLSAQTGVELSASDADGAAGQMVVARLQNVPLGDVMDALWSLVSYKHAEWDWKVVPAAAPVAKNAAAAPAPPSYLLTRPRAAQMLGRKIHDQIQQDFEDEAEVLLAAVKPGGSQPAPGGALGELLADKRTRAGLETLSETLTPEQRQRGLRGERFKIPVAELGDKGKAFVEMEWQLDRKYNPDVRGPGYSTPPTYIELDISQGGITPSLFILLEGSGGGSYVGSKPFREKWAKNLTDLWMHEGDAATDAREALTVIAPKNAPGGTPEKSLSLRWPPALWQIADAASVSFLCRVAGPNINDRGAPYNLTVQKALEDKLYPLRYKWRNGLLLLSDPTWFYKKGGSQESLVSWSVIKRLKQAEATAGDGMLPFAELLRTASELKPPDLKALENAFPAFRQVAMLRDWFVWMHRDPASAARMQTPEGMPRRDLPAGLRAVLPAEVDDKKVVSVRLKVQDYRLDDTGEPVRVVDLETIDEGGKKRTLSTFSYRASERVLAKP